MKKKTFFLLVCTTVHFATNVVAQNKVGIGTTTPFSKLSVQTMNGNYGITHTDGTITVGTYIGNSKAWFGTNTNHPLSFFTNNSNEQLTLLTNGNLGIGTTTPASKLTISTPNNTDGFMHVSDGGIVLRSGVGGISAVMGTSSNHTFRLTANNMAILNLEPSGFVGVGVTDAAYKMDIADRIRIRSSSASNTAGLWLNNPLNTAAVAFIGIKSVDLVGIYGNGSGWGLAMNTNTGDLSVGSQNPVAGYKLSVHGNSYVNGSVVATGNIEVSGFADITGNAVVGGSVNASHYSDNGWTMNGIGDIFIINGWGTQLELHDGDIDVYSISDKKLKKDIHSLPPVLNKVMQLTPSQYYYVTDTASTRLSTGFIAQEVQNIFPGLVHTITNPDETSSLSLAYRQFVVIAIKAIQEQQQIIDSLQTQLNAMETRFSALEEKLIK